MAVQTQVVGLDALRAKVKRLANMRPVTESLRRNLSNTWTSGAEQFVRAAVRQVLVDTGMSAASFFPLSRAIGRIRAQQAITRHIAQNAKSGPKRGEPTFPSGERRVPGYQDIESGERLGERAYTFTIPSPNSRQFVFRFAFRTVVYQHAYWEFQQESLAEGIIAFEETIRRRFTQDARLIIRQYLRTGRPPRGLLRGIE